MRNFLLLVHCLIHYSSRVIKEMERSFMDLGIGANFYQVFGVAIWATRRGVVEFSAAL